MSVPARELENPGHFYAERVMSGEILANDLIALACQRYLDDWRFADQKEFDFRPEYAWHAIEFIESLTFSKGKWFKKPFRLAPWEKFAIWNMYGWFLKYHPQEFDVDPPDWIRRIRTAFYLVPRKTGKSEFSAVNGLYLANGDGENMAEVYSAATTRDQAKLVWNAACVMRANSPELRDRSRKNASLLRFDDGSFFKPLAKNYDKLDGLNASGVIIDELHQHPDGGMVQVLQDSIDAREQPMVIMISTAGNNIASYCYSEQQRCERILRGQQCDETTFAMIYVPDKGDEWTDPTLWRKVNPGLGSTISFHGFKAQFEKARSNKREQARFKQVRLNFWTGTDSPAIDLEKWRQCKTDRTLHEFKGLECIGAIDLANTQDLNALVLNIFVDGKYYIFPFFWCPEDVASIREKEDRVPYMAWANEGYLRLFPGARRDNSYIVRCVEEEILPIVDLQMLFADPWNASDLYKPLEDLGVNIIEHRQGFASMNEPSKHFEIAYGDTSQKQTLRHPGSPVLDWCAGNLVWATDASNNIKPDKKKAREKIDGMVAMIMTFSGFLPGVKEEESGYNAEVKKMRDLGGSQSQRPRLL
jgi:phage terminase large subunit-like protein